MVIQSQRADRVQLETHLHDLRLILERMTGVPATNGSADLPFVLAAWIFLVGIFGIVRSRHFIHLVVCLSLTQSSTYVLLLSVGYVKRGGAPTRKARTLRRQPRGG